VKIKAHAVMAGDPEVELRGKVKPIAFDCSAEGRLKFATGIIAAEIGELPVRLRIPFLRRPAALVVVGSLGPFDIRIHPLEAELGPVTVHASGVAGKEGVEGEVTGKVCCKTTFDVDGVIPGKVTRVAFDVGEQENADVESAEEP
jgi:hypothetical protein